MPFIYYLVLLNNQTANQNLLVLKQYAHPNYMLQHYEKRNLMIGPLPRAYLTRKTIQHIYIESGVIKKYYSQLRGGIQTQVVTLNAKQTFGRVGVLLLLLLILITQARFLLSQVGSLVH